MKRVLKFTFSLSALTIISNLVLIIFLITNSNNIDSSMANDLPFSIPLFIVFSGNLVFYCYSIFNYNVVNGEKSIKKLSKLLIFFNWIDLLLIWFTLIEINDVQQNPFTNPPVILSWLFTTILCYIIYCLDKKSINI